MTTLFVSGDSWTSCWPLEQELGHRNFGWPILVSNHFNFDLVDKSRAGSSNYRIYRKAFDGLLNGANLVLVFLTSWTRFETGATFGPKPGQIYQHISHKKESTEAFRLFFNGYKNYTDMLRQIIALQALSSVKQVPCYFLDTFDNNLSRNLSIEEFKQILKFNIEVYDNTDDQRIESKYNVIKNLESMIDWNKFISTQSYQSLIKGSKLLQMHPIEDGHSKIAQIVINFLESTHHGKTI